VKTKSTKTAKQAPVVRDVSPLETSLTAEAVVQLPPDPNPAILTLDWQLQYPPGGSTHPSYAYPQLDPRLMFNPSLVPVVDGLPTILAVPPLVLPMGWRHVSWSGFLPIVFDPYHQGFKLTPIGPLPLTCEEVQQGGLAKFVPGGECHPEAGLLPDASAFSDGSDEEKYSFDGVDWVLPWPQGETFGSSTSVEAGQHAIESPTSAKGLPAPDHATPPFYIETRDCPDGIVDIEDAWRWIKEKETNPDAAFIPSPTKTWRGTGIHRTTKKIKVPIASLMGLAIDDLRTSPNEALASYLLKQDTRDFCPFRSMATPVNINITLLKDIEVTIVELLSYFPNIYIWRKAADRFVRAGLTAADIMNFINWSRCLEGDAVVQSRNVQDQIWYVNDGGGSRKKIRIVREQKDNEAISYTTEGWVHTEWELTDYPLFGLTHGLKHVPEGPDAGPLTAMIKWCREQGRYDPLLSDVPQLLEGAGLQPLIEPGETGDPDREVLGRHAETLREDRKRVLRIAKEKKRALEEAEEKDEKRTKRMKTE